MHTHTGGGAGEGMVCGVCSSLVCGFKVTLEEVVGWGSQSSRCRTCCSPVPLLSLQQTCPSPACAACVSSPFCAALLPTSHCQVLQADGSVLAVALNAIAAALADAGIPMRSMFGEEGVLLFLGGELGRGGGQ